MYKVLIIYDEPLKKYRIFDADIKRNDLEFVSADSQEDICSSIEKTKPDIVVLSIEYFEKCKLKLLFSLHKAVKNCHFLLLSDSNWHGYTNDIGSELPTQYHILDFSNSEEVFAALGNIVNILKSCRAKENFEKMVLQEAERVKPIIREQFLKEYILGVGDTAEIFNIYCKTFNVRRDSPVRMFIFRPEQGISFEETFFLRNIIEGHVGNDSIILGTIIKENVLIVASMIDDARVSNILRRLERVFDKYYTYKITTVYSGVHPVSDSPKVYEKLNKCLEYCFYTCGDGVIFAEDICIDGSDVVLEPNYGAIERAVKGADSEKVKFLMHNFFYDIDKSKVEPALAKTYCLELFVCIIRCCEVEKIDKYMKGIVVLQEFKTLREIKEYIIGTAMEIVQANSPKDMRVYSSLIHDTIEIIDKNLGNEQLSLRWIANNILYTNVDYLGKLFKKEVGENFSHYVMEKRMEMAKNLILNGKKDRIYEVAEKVGYGSNSQYFSQVFKKYTGVSPLEYKEYARLSVVG